MAKIDYVKYLALGAGAVAIPSFAGETVSGFLVKIPTIGTFLAQPLFSGVTPIAVVLAAASVGLIDQLLFNK